MGGRVRALDRGVSADRETITSAEGACSAMQGRCVIVVSMAWHHWTIGAFVVLAACFGETTPTSGGSGAVDTGVSESAGADGAGSDDLSQMEDPFPWTPCGEGGAEDCESEGPRPIVDGDQCQSSSDCRHGVCVAAFGETRREAYMCLPTCIPTFDESWWCSDDASCCNPDAYCNPRGYCRLPEGGSGTDDTGTMDTGSGSDETSGTESDTTESTG